VGKKKINRRLVMGFVYVNVVIHGKKSKPVEMLVDTGSTYIVLDCKVIEELGLIEKPYKVKLTLADKDKREIEVRLFLAEVELEGRRGQHL
jgi:predicted aspartyl protease